MSLWLVGVEKNRDQVVIFSVLSWVIYRQQDGTYSEEV